MTFHSTIDFEPANGVDRHGTHCVRSDDVQNRTSSLHRTGDDRLERVLDRRAVEAERRGRVDLDDADAEQLELGAIELDETIPQNDDMRHVRRGHVDIGLGPATGLVKTAPYRRDVVDSGEVGWCLAVGRRVEQEDFVAQRGRRGDRATNAVEAENGHNRGV